YEQSLRESIWNLIKANGLPPNRVGRTEEFASRSRMPVIITDLNRNARDSQGADHPIFIVFFGSVIVAHENCTPTAEPEIWLERFPGSTMANEIRVLIAEDDVNMHDEWRESLAAWGFRGEIAEDGVRALELIRSFDPHILLSDLM